MIGVIQRQLIDTPAASLADRRVRRTDWGDVGGQPIRDSLRIAS